MKLATALNVLFRPVIRSMTPVYVRGDETRDTNGIGLSAFGFSSVPALPRAAPEHAAALPAQPKPNDYKNHPYPPCPSKPTKPKSPHPDWTVVCLLRPRCVLDDEGKMVWVFYYYTDGTHTRWFPPPPPESDRVRSPIDDTIDLTEQPSKRAATGVRGSLVPIPHENTYAMEIAGDVPEEGIVTELPEEEEDVEEMELEEMTPKELTFTLDLPKRLYMNPTETQLSAYDECEKIGVSRYGPDGKNRTRNELSKALRIHLINVVHEGDLDSYNDSDCFTGKIFFL